MFWILTVLLSEDTGLRESQSDDQPLMTHTCVPVAICYDKFSILGGHTVNIFIQMVVQRFIIISCTSVGSTTGIPAH